MKKLLLAAFIGLTGAAQAQVTVFEDGFENHPNFALDNFGGWNTLDLDLLTTYIGGLPTGVTAWPGANTAQAWMVFNPSAAQVTNSTDACTAAGGENRTFDPYAGQKYAGSWAGVPSTTGGAQANSDWLISPPITLGSSNNNVEFYIKQLSTCYGTEKFRVGVFVGTTTPTANNQFTVISGIPAQNASTTWSLKSYSLNAYSNQTIRIGIKNESADAYLLMVDNFKVTSSNLSANETLAAKFSTFPNPATTVITLANTESIRVNSVSITDINGRTVKTLNFTDAPSTIEINVADLSAGVYMMNITSDAGSTVKKIVKN